MNESVLTGGARQEGSPIPSLPRAETAHSESGREHLRALVTTIGREMSTLPGEAMRESDAASAQRLSSAWTELVELLALGPTPQLRICPACGHEGMRAATRCGHCWEKLSLLAASA